MVVERYGDFYYVYTISQLEPHIYVTRQSPLKRFRYFLCFYCAEIFPEDIAVALRDRLQNLFVGVLELL